MHVAYYMQIKNWEINTWLCTMLFHNAVTSDILFSIAKFTFLEQRQLQATRSADK